MAADRVPDRRPPGVGDDHGPLPQVLGGEAQRPARAVRVVVAGHHGTVARDRAGRRQQQRAVGVVQQAGCGASRARPAPAGPHRACRTRGGPRRAPAPWLRSVRHALRPVSIVGVASSPADARELGALGRRRARALLGLRRACARCPRGSSRPAARRARARRPPSVGGGGYTVATVVSAPGKRRAGDRDRRARGVRAVVADQQPGHRAPSSAGSSSSARSLATQASAPSRRARAANAGSSSTPITITRTCRGLRAEPGEHVIGAARTRRSSRISTSGRTRRSAAARSSRDHRSRRRARRRRGPPEGGQRAARASHERRRAAPAPDQRRRAAQVPHRGVPLGAMRTTTEPRLTSRRTRPRCRAGRSSPRSGPG